MPWFTTKGQICQLVVTFVALCIAGYKAWPDMVASEYLSGGAILFYALVLIVVRSFLHLVAAIRKSHLPASTSAGSSMRPHGILGDFVNIRFEKARYGSDVITDDALKGLNAALSDSKNHTADGDVSIGIGDYLVGKDPHHNVYKSLRLTVSAELHGGKPLTIRPRDRIVQSSAIKSESPEVQTIPQRPADADPGKEPTLSSLMNADFPSLMKLHGKPVLQFADGPSCQIEDILYVDFRAGSKFIGIYVPSSPKSLEIVSSLAPTAKQLGDELAKSQ